jgi:hypothetical protein
MLRQQTPRQQTPRQQTPRQQTPRQQTPRQQTPRQQTPRQQTPTTPIVDWSAIQQVDLVNRLGQLAASQPRDGEMDTGWDPATITQNEPDSENGL